MAMVVINQLYQFAHMIFISFAGSSSEGCDSRMSLAVLKSARLYSQILRRQGFEEAVWQVDRDSSIQLWSDVARGGSMRWVPEGCSER